jgi:hypothetical protein
MQSPAVSGEAFLTMSVHAGDWVRRHCRFPRKKLQLDLI